MKSYSQAFQDLFVVAALKGKRNGTFIDIGCFHPTDGNNTFLLESELGWSGISIDKYHQDWSLRKSIFMMTDASTRWGLSFMDQTTSAAYLSLDIDEDTNKALSIMAEIGCLKNFKVITIEHDRYARGVSEREEQRRILTGTGYVMVVGDVFPTGRSHMPFEDWWVAPNIATPPTAPQSTEDRAVAEWFWDFSFNQPLP